MKMKELPISERPYEKLQMYGEKALSNAELLAIIIKNGTKEESSIILAQKILLLAKEKGCHNDNLTFLQELTIEDFMKIKGIGKIKALQLKAVCEFAKRISKPIDNTKIKINNKQDVVNLVMYDFQFEKKEIIKVLILNSQNVLLKMQNIAYGGTNSVNADVKDVFSEAIKMQASKIIIVHNHPSGDPSPSKRDINFTNKMYKASILLDILLLDHIIIGENKYISIKEYENNKIINKGSN